MCNNKSENRSPKGSNFKEDDRALPIKQLLLYGWDFPSNILSPKNTPQVHKICIVLLVFLFILFFYRFNIYPNIDIYVHMYDGVRNLHILVQYTVHCTA